MAAKSRRLRSCNPSPIREDRSPARVSTLFYLPIFSDGTDLKGVIDFGDGNTLNAEEAQSALSDDVYYIVPDKCTECVGFHDEPQCAAVCPVDCCVDDEDVRETKEELLAKKEWLHIQG